MKLVELHVHHLRAGQVCQRHAVAGRHLRVGGVAIQPAGPAGAHDHNVALEHLPAGVAVGSHHLDAGCRAVGDADADGVGVLQDRDAL